MLQVPDTAGPFGSSGGDNTITVALANYGSGVQALGEQIGGVFQCVCVDLLQSVPSAFLHINQAPWLFAAGAFFPWLFAGGFSPWLVALDFTVAWCCGWAVSRFPQCSASHGRRQWRFVLARRRPR